MKILTRFGLATVMVLTLISALAVPHASADDGDLATVGFATGVSTADTAATDDDEVDEIIDDIVDEVERIEREREVREAIQAMNRVLCSLGLTQYCGLSSSFGENVNAFAPAGLPLAQYSCTTVSCGGYNYGYSWGHRLCWAQYGLNDPRCWYG